MSNQHPHCMARALDYCPSLQHLCVGHNDGTISIRKVEGIDNTDGTPVKFDTTVDIMNHPKEWIEIMRYTKEGDRLAVGSHDNFIYVYATSQNGPDGKYKALGKLIGHSSYITALDWSIDGEWIRSSCGAYELLFF